MTMHIVAVPTALDQLSRDQTVLGDIDRQAHVAAIDAGEFGAQLSRHLDAQTACGVIVGWFDVDRGQCRCGIALEKLADKLRCHLLRIGQLIGHVLHQVVGKGGIKSVEHRARIGRASDIVCQRGRLGEGVAVGAIIVVVDRHPLDIVAQLCHSLGHGLTPGGKRCPLGCEQLDELFVSGKRLPVGDKCGRDFSATRHRLAIDCSDAQRQRMLAHRHPSEWTVPLVVGVVKLQCHGRRDGGLALTIDQHIDSIVVERGCAEVAQCHTIVQALCDSGIWVCRQVGHLQLVLRKILVLDNGLNAQVAIGRQPDILPISTRQRSIEHIVIQWQPLADH